MPKKTFFNLEEKKQDKIIRSAISEFTKYGFERAKMDTIAKNANVSKGSMYQYFDNKEELFLFSVKWSIDLFYKRYGRYLNLKKDMNIFDLFYKDAKIIWSQMMEERDMVIFIQDVLLGKYKNLTDKSMSYIMDMVNKNTLNMIQNGKRNGSIRKDIDDNLLLIFITGVSLKFKEHMMNSARTQGKDIVDEGFEENEREIKSMIELLKNGMGENRCLFR
ncbi:MAG TPA: TetR/AcrR family transcriptional regulator [Clostridium sp.]|nr:TetR/AcrR family transcriptional regulator [Clostridiales bacterium]HBC96807.1 TetR/AcrR family transcriptional regulator [Clostridium sp.]